MTQGSFLAKNNGFAGMKSVRLAHLMCPFWGQLMGVAFRRNTRRLKTTWPHQQHAYLPGRRRETPIATLRATTDRLRHNKTHFVAAFKDMTNAFASTGKDKLKLQSAR